MEQKKIVDLHTGDKVQTEHLEYTATVNGLYLTGYYDGKVGDKAQMLVIPADNPERVTVIGHYDIISYQGEGYSVVEGTPKLHVLVKDDELSLALNGMKTTLNYTDTHERG